MNLKLFKRKIIIILNKFLFHYLLGVPILGMPFAYDQNAVNTFS